MNVNYKVIDFWKWSVSDLVSNATRGRLAEFIVAKALKIKGLSGMLGNIDKKNKML